MNKIKEGREKRREREKKKRSEMKLEAWKENGQFEKKRRASRRRAGKKRILGEEYDHYIVLTYDIIKNVKFKGNR